MRALRIFLVPLLIVAFALALAACNGDDDDDVVVTPTPDNDVPPPPPDELGSVLAMIIWGGSELDSFEALVAPWEDATGGDMRVISTRDITAQLTLTVEGGAPPDVAIPAEIGLFRDFARAGQIIPLSDCPGLEEKILAEYPQAFIDLGTVDGTLYGFWMKADGKSTIWYNPGLFDEHGFEPLTADATFDDLLAFTDEIAESGAVDAPWSIGVESAEASGWPGTDWVEAILVNNVEGGVDVFDGIIDGTVPFTDPRVQEAFEMFGQIALPPENTVQGGPAGINATSFRDAIFPPFTDPPTAALHHQASFVPGELAADLPGLVAGEDFDFFPWPGGAAIGSANIVYAFNSDPTTCSFLDHLASAEAQQIWVERGGFTSVNENVDLDAYPDDVARNAAERLLTADVFRFDLDDTIGGAWQLAFWSGVTEYLANPGQLESILASVEAAREEEVVVE
jgi:alpha-glucoside transport system substrate-binding protein